MKHGAGIQRSEGYGKGVRLAPVRPAVRGILLLVAVGCAGTTSQMSAPLIEYHRSGGIRGNDDRLVINRDGTADLTRNGKASSITVAREIVSRLPRLLQQAGFADLRREYPAPRGGADMYQYEITHDGHTVRGREDTLPEALHPVVQLLDDILDTT